MTTMSPCARNRRVYVMTERKRVEVGAVVTGASGSTSKSANQSSVVRARQLCLGEDQPTLVKELKDEKLQQCEAMAIYAWPRGK